VIEFEFFIFFFLKTKIKVQIKVIAQHVIRQTLDAIHLKMSSFRHRQNDTWIYSKFIPRLSPITLNYPLIKFIIFNHWLYYTFLIDLPSEPDTAFMYGGIVFLGLCCCGGGCSSFMVIVFFDLGV
jgi:hypothetical protein